VANGSITTFCCCGMQASANATHTMTVADHAAGGKQFAPHLLHWCQTNTMCAELAAYVSSGTSWPTHIRFHNPPLVADCRARQRPEAEASAPAGGCAGWWDPLLLWVQSCAGLACWGSI
jgi:hypothetical protein